MQLNYIDRSILIAKWIRYKKIFILIDDKSMFRINDLLLLYISVSMLKSNTDNVSGFDDIAGLLLSLWTFS